MAEFDRNRDSAPAGRVLLWPRFDDTEPTSWLLNLALLIVLCVVVMAIASVALRQWRPSPVAVVGVDGTVVSAVAPQPSPERAALREELTVSEELEKQSRLKATQAADLRREAAIKDREAAEAATARAAALEARWEREWQAYYKKPAYCDETTQPIVDSVGCANDYIRARRAFDERFVAASRR